MDVKLRVIAGSRQTAEVVLRGKENFIGRQADCKLRIPSASVSRLHCRLCTYGGHVTVEDLGSANGSFLNGKRIDGVKVVQPGDRLQIGPVVFVIEYQPDAATEEGAKRIGPAPGRPPAPDAGEKTMPARSRGVEDDIVFVFDADD